MIRNVLLNCDNWEKTALIEEERRISYEDLARKALALHSGIPYKGKGVTAIFLPNGADFIAALFGVFLFASTAFPLNYMLTEQELTPLLKKVSPEAVITSKEFGEILEIIKTKDLHTLQIIYIEELEYHKLEKLPVTIPANPKEAMILLNTSGTTGNVKIVKLSEENIEAAVFGYLDKVDLELEEVTYILAAPFFSVYGLMILCSCLYKALPIVLLPKEVTLNTLYKAVQQHGVTHYEGGAAVPLLMERMADRTNPYDISSLKYIAFGGSKVAGNTIQNLEDAYPAICFRQGYGMTETAGLISKYKDTPLHYTKVAKTGESVGTAITGMEIAIGADETITERPYIKGEVLVKGPNVMLGYYENQKETRCTIKNGYLYTGDIGYLDENGYLYLCGRKKNIIIVRGLNVHPEEVETCIYNSSLVLDCIVYGEQDEFETEMVCTDIIPVTPQIQAVEIMEYCKKHLAEYKRPGKIRIVKEIPKAASGKNKRIRKEQP